MELAKSIIDQRNALAHHNSPWKDHFREMAFYVLPSMSRADVTVVVDRLVNQPHGAQASPSLYDHTAIMAIDRLTAGEMSLVMPSNAHWHDLAKDDLFTDKPTDEERQFMDKLRNYLFKMRYNPSTGFPSAAKAAIKSRCAFGTGVMYVQENFGFGSEKPISYRYIPILENDLAANFEGIVDTNYRTFTKTAKQCVGKWGNRCSPKVQQMAGDSKRCNDPVELIHAVFPASNYPDMRSNMPFASFYVEVGERHVLSKSGYHEFPYIVLHWDRESQGAYSEGPVSKAFSEIKSLNLLAKESLVSAQQWVNPPTASTDDGFNRPNLGPGAHNPGLLSETGELLIKPVITQTNPSFALDMVNAKQDALKETLYVTLWQILIKNPQMTATEVLQRQQEKADLLGPSGLSLQNGLAAMVDREVNILDRKDAFAQGELQAPDSFVGKSIAVSFTGPLDRMRRASELQGIDRTLEQAARLAEIGKTEVLDRIDEDKVMEISQEINGAPASIFRSDDDVEQIRAQRAEQEAQQAEAERMMAESQAAQMAGQGIEALQNATQ